MSNSSRSLLSLLQRCVAVRQITVSTGIRTRGTGLSSRFGFIQERAWTSTTRTDCLQRLCQLQSTVRLSQSSFCTKEETPLDNEYPPLPEYESSSEVDKNETHIVQVKGLPWSCTDQDLLQFFSDCSIRNGVEGIHLVVDMHGRASGYAFIEMEHKEDVSKALEKHRQYLGLRYVQVQEVTDKEAEGILQKLTQAPVPDGAEERKVCLRGLPFSSGKDDIVTFFSGLDIVEDGITIHTDYLGRSTGKATVEFSSEAAAAEALQKDRNLIGQRYIEVFSFRSYRGNLGSRWGPQRRRHQTDIHVIRMRGLPYRTSGIDIAEFFSPVVVSKILIECRSDGKATGEAEVYFSSHKDAVAAMTKDRHYMGQRYIELFLNSESQ